MERPGELVGKHQLMGRVWRGTVVREGNLKFQVGALRRALGDGRDGRRYIATSPGQGYSFVAPVSVEPNRSGRRLFSRAPAATGELMTGSEGSLGARRADRHPDILATMDSLPPEPTQSWFLGKVAVAFFPMLTFLIAELIGGL